MKSKDFAVALFQPPFNNLSMPLLGAPTLKSYLKSVGFPQVRCIDSSIEYWLQETKPSNLERAATELATTLDSEEAKRVLNIGHMSADSIDVAKSIFRDHEQFYDAELYDFATRTWNAAIQLLGLSDLKSTGATVLEEPAVAAGISRIRELVQDPRKLNRLKLYARERLLSLGRVDLVGFSVVFLEQLAPAIVMAAVAKQVHRNVHVCFGGPIVSRFADELIRNPGFFDYFDSVVLREGEFPFEALCRQLAEHGKIRDLPDNILVRTPTGVVEGRETNWAPDYSNLPIPDFDDYDLTSYLVPHPLLPVITTRNCYWGKCTFCGHVLAKSGYALKPVDKVIDLLKYYKHQYGVSRFYFVDDSLVPKFLNDFASQILDGGLEFNFYGDCRADPYFTIERMKNLRHAGCLALYVGVEAASDRVQSLIGKGQTNAAVSEFVLRAHEAGIGIKLNIFLGYPSETREEIADTFEMIQRLKTKADLVSLGVFQLEKDVPMFNSPEKFNIKVIGPFDQDSELNLTYRYVSESGVSQEQAQALRRSYWSTHADGGCGRKKLLYRDHHPLLLERADPSWFDSTSD